jgi:hypothetical protein
VVFSLYIDFLKHFIYLRNVSNFDETGFAVGLTATAMVILQEGNNTVGEQFHNPEIASG